MSPWIGSVIVLSGWRSDSSSPQGRVRRCSAVRPHLGIATTSHSKIAAFAKEEQDQWHQEAGVDEVPLKVIPSGQRRPRLFAPRRGPFPRAGYIRYWSRSLASDLLEPNVIS